MGNRKPTLTLHKSLPVFRRFMGTLPLFLFLGLCLFALNCTALDVPPLKGYVNDYAGMISPAAKAKIETELRNFEQSDSTQVFILTIPSLQGEPLEDYSIKVAEQWKAGLKGKDNGVILLVSKGDRKMRIEVGRGLEGRLTDLTAGQIVDLVIKPRFSRGDFDGGFVAAASAIIDATHGEFKAQPRKVPASRRGGSSFSPFLAFLIFGGIALFFIAGISRILGAIAGAIGLPALIYFALLPLGIIPLVILGLVGLGIGILLPLLFSGGGPGGGGWWFFGGGGPWGGGGGGGDGGGGFDGGGGGDFGGGGASGDW
jgi:uncharacterized protein